MLHQLTEIQSIHSQYIFVAKLTIVYDITQKYSGLFEQSTKKRYFCGQNKIAPHIMTFAIDPTYTRAITEKEWGFIQREAKYNLPKHISKAYFGRTRATHTISPKCYRRICLIIAYCIYEHNNNPEYMKQLLIDIFEHIKRFSAQYAKDHAGSIMCEIHKYVRLYLQYDLHPENIQVE